ncbi:histidine kinase [Algiphilus sp.]|uniref:sensor histidine kinase n=1 Tax=Algiphilus sp. TaxID=1872431 RepID=UPI002A661657|nr:histidine kinase [Pseudomonadota bacterium]
MSTHPSLQRQLVLGVSTIALLTLVFSMLLVMQHARRSVMAETQASTALVAELVSAWPVMPSATHASQAIVTLQAAIRDSRHLCAVTLRDSESAACYKAASAAAPRWFIAGLALPSDIGSAQLSLDTGEGPLPITVVADTRYEIEEAWRESRGIIVFLVLFALGVVGLVIQAFRRVSRLLHGVTGQVQRIALGDYRPDGPAPAMPRELVPLFDAVSDLRLSLDAATFENRQLARQCMEAQERERRDVARELHDEVGQHLSAAEAQLAVAARCADPCARTAATEQVRDSLRAIFGSVHGILGRLRPAAIDSVGLLAALEQLAVDWRAEDRGIALTVSLSGDDRRLDPRVGIHVYRVAQEALTNIGRHAVGARHAVLHCCCNANGAVELVVCDDGPGLTAQPAGGGGFGLRGMRERAASIDARFVVESGRAWSTVIRLTRTEASMSSMPVSAHSEAVTQG